MSGKLVGDWIWKLNPDAEYKRSGDPGKGGAYSLEIVALAVLQSYADYLGDLL